MQSFQDTLGALIAQRAEPWQIDYFRAVVGDMQRAYSEHRGRTGPLPICGISLELEPLRDREGRLLAYTKPLMLLIDETSASGAEVFAAQIQDARRAVIFGMRTSGLGGITASWQMTTYSEATGRITFGLMNRKEAVTTPDYPAAPYIENVGVRPDIVVDYMTKENLLNRGEPFVRRFTEEIVKHVRNSQ